MDVMNLDRSGKGPPSAGDGPDVVPPEDREWRSWLAAQSIPTLESPLLMRERGRVVVVAPHPDDEILGCGGLLAALVQRSPEIRIITVSNGEASHPNDPAWTPALLAQARRAEQARGLARMGFDANCVLRLGLPDGAVGAHRASLMQHLRSNIVADDLVLTTWRHDGHPDHEATGDVVAQVCAEQGGRLLEMPVWMWEWSYPADPRVPWHRLRVFSLPPATLDVKVAALGEHTTQLAPRGAEPPILAAGILSRASRRAEYFFV